MPVALWTVNDSAPVRLEQRRDFAERHLETWIEADASMVGGEGMSWVARQPRLPDGSIPDLIGMTREGGLVVAELKRDAVNIATLAQALHYVLMLGAMDVDAILRRLKLSEEQRSVLQTSYETGSGPEVSIMLIGTSRAPELERAAVFLSDRGLNVPVRIVTFTPYQDASQTVFLSREVEEHELAPSDLSAQQRSSRSAKIEWVQDMAREAGVADVVEAFLQAAAELGLRIKPWPKSLTIVPPFTRGRTLLYIAPKSTGVLHLGHSTENITELYGADPADVRQALGRNWIDASSAEARTVVSGFVELMQRLQASDTTKPTPAAAGSQPRGA
jgi:hypothetical protein